MKISKWHSGFCSNVSSKLAEWTPRAIQFKWYQRRCFYDARNDRTLFVLWGLHYVVTLAMWIVHQWQREMRRASWFEMAIVSRTGSEDPYKARKIIDEHLDLIMAVQRIFPGETRFKTALRYIMEAEQVNLPDAKPYDPHAFDHREEEMLGERMTPKHKPAEH